MDASKSVEAESPETQEGTIERSIAAWRDVAAWLDRTPCDGLLKDAAMPMLREAADLVERLAAAPIPIEGGDTPALAILRAAYDAWRNDASADHVDVITSVGAYLNSLRPGAPIPIGGGVMADTMDLKQLIAGLTTLNAPDQGMSYHSGGPRRGAPKYNSYTGERLPVDLESTSLSIYGGRAQFIYDLIKHSRELAAQLAVLAPGAAALGEG